MNNSRLLRVGQQSLSLIADMGHAGLFLWSVITSRIPWRRIVPLISEQLYRAGIMSLLITILAGFFIGMVVGLQGFHTLQKFSAEQALGKLLALSIVRELGPVIAALLFAGRAGSSLTAELGLMATTDQLSAMRMLGVNPLWRVVAPRFWGALIALPLLTLIFDVVAIYGGSLVGVDWLGVDRGAFWSGMQSVVEFGGDVMNGVLKSGVFAFLIVWISLYQGYFCEPNAKGMSIATTKTVVYGSLAVLAFDFILTALVMGGW